MKDITTAAIRVDASRQIGTGHFMRCLVLADALKRAGLRIRFVSRHMPDHLHEMLDAHGHGCVLLGDVPSGERADELPHSAWLGASQASDARQTLQALEGCHWDWLVVDHYALDARWEAALRRAAGRILVIDDLADRCHDCNLLLDQNLHADMVSRYKDKVPENFRLLLGPGYALLREEFRRLRASLRMRDGSVKRILVLMGGVDAGNQTEKAMHAIAKLPGRSFEVDVVIGLQHPAPESIEAACRRFGFQLHVQTRNVAELMAAADLSIGAAGSSSWERCCLGLPALCLTHAANQVALAQGLQARGAIVSVGNAAEVSTADLSQALSSLLRQPERLRSLSLASASLVDGAGAERVRAHLLEAT